MAMFTQLSCIFRKIQCRLILGFYMQKKPEMTRSFLSTTMGMLGNTSLLDKKDAPELHKVIEEYSQRLGVKAPDLVYADSHVPNAMMIQYKNGSNQLLLSKGLITLDGMKNFSDVPAAGLKGMVAHELSHLKDGAMLGRVSRKLPLFAAPVCAAGAYYLLSEYYKKPVKDADRFFDEHKPAEASACQPGAGCAAKIFPVAAALAAGAAGLVGGVYASRALNFAAEYRADRMAGHFTNDAKAFSDFLGKMIKAMEESMPKTATHSVKLVQPSASFEGALNAMITRIRSYLKQEKFFYNLEVTHAHPTFQQRETALRNAFPQHFNVGQSLI